VAAASAGLAGAAAASASSESIAVPELESMVALGPESGSEEDLLLDLGDSGPLEFEETTDSRPAVDSLKLELDSGAAVPEVEEIEQAIEGGDIDSILPLPEDSVGLDLDLGLPDETPKSAERAPTATGPQAGGGILDLDLEVPSLDGGLGELDLSIDDLGRLDEPLRSPEPPILEPSDRADESLEALDSGLPPEQESVPTDLLSSQWQMDSASGTRPRPSSIWRVPMSRWTTRRPRARSWKRSSPRDATSSATRRVPCWSDWVENALRPDRIALGVEYDGTHFRGWQTQSGVRTVQSDLEAAVSGSRIIPSSFTAAGRTDAGVHALEQVVHFETTATRSERSWVLGPMSICRPMSVCAGRIRSMTAFMRASAPGPALSLSDPGTAHPLAAPARSCGLGA
jgi:hypothetical protein